MPLNDVTKFIHVPIIDPSKLVGQLMHDDKIILGLRDRETNIFQYVGQVNIEDFARLNNKLMETYGGAHWFDAWTTNVYMDQKHASDLPLLIAHLSLDPYVVDKETRSRITVETLGNLTLEDRTDS